MKKSDIIWIKSMKFCSKYCRCHQLPQRSFFVKGYQLPLCARCTGIFIGNIIVVLLLPLKIADYKFALFMLPMIIDGGIQYMTEYRSNNIRRLVTGIMFGISSVLLICWLLLQLLLLF